MKFKIFVASILFFCFLLPGINLAQNKVVVIPVMSECGNKIPTVTSAGGRMWMDRNLGAYRVAQSWDDYRAYGWLYQWGRLADGHEDRGSETTAVLSTGDDPGHGDFITTSSSPYDWRNPQNDNLWQGVSGTNNPCPAGFRVPTETEWDTERASWISNDRGGAFASSLKLVVAGYGYITSGTVYNAGNLGYCWSSTVSGSDARCLHFSSRDAFMGSNGRAFGYSFRCIKD